MKGLALCASSFPQPPSFTDRTENVCVRSHVCSDRRTPTAATSTTPTGLLALLLASGGNFLLPILLSAAQLAASRRWPDSDIPQDIERVKVVVNIAGAATTSLVAALKRWRMARLAAAAAAAEVLALAEAALPTEMTALLPGHARSRALKTKTSRRAGEKRHVRFDAELIEINMKEDQAQMAILLPVP